MMTAQITPEQAGEVLQKAAEHSWESGLLAFMMLTSLVALVWLVRTWLNQASMREKEMGVRITALEDFNRVELKVIAVQSNAVIVESNSAIERNTVALKTLVDVLTNRPCFWSADKQAEIMSRYTLKPPPGPA
jgi:hypothetical protein